MNTTSQSAPASAETPAMSCKGFMDTLVGLGTTWAAYGLKVGKMALATSAETLGKTAETLDTLANAMEKKAAATAAAHAESDPKAAPAVKDAPAAPAA